MGFSKDIYSQKLMELYGYFRQEAKSQDHALYMEYSLLDFLSGNSENEELQKGLTVRFSYKGDSFNGQLSQNFVSCVSTGLKRLITKAYLGIQRENVLRKEYTDKLNFLQNELEGQRKLVRHYKHLAEIAQTSSSPIPSYPDMVSRYEYDLVSGELQEYKDMVDDGRLILREEYERVKKQAEAKAPAPMIDMKKYVPMSKYEELVFQKSKTDKANRSLLNKVFELENELNSLSSDSNDDENGEVLEVIDSGSTATTAAPVIEIDYQSELKALSEQVEKLDSDNASLTKDYQELEKKYSDLQARNQSLTDRLEEKKKEKRDYLKIIQDYRNDEKAVVPDLQEIIFRRVRQGKGVSLSKKEIKQIVKGYLNNMTLYGIEKEYKIPRHSSRSVINCDYKGLSSLKTVLSVLKEMNGHWTEERKELLVSLIEQYEAEVVLCEEREKRIKEQIKKQVVSLRTYREAKKGSYIDYGFMDDNPANGGQFRIGEKPVVVEYIEEDSSNIMGE